MSDPRHIERQIPPLAHTAMYSWHKYWARKTWNVVGKFVETYCAPDGVVLDPFAGSGVVGIEAVRRGRRAILADLLPVTEELVWATLVDVTPEAISAAFSRVEAAVKDRVQSLYETVCRECGAMQASSANVWEDGVLTALRFKCDRCGQVYAKGAAARAEDHVKADAALGELGDHWFPTNKFRYPDGQTFITARDYSSVDELFTPRNLLAFALVMEAIEGERDRRLSRLLKVAFTSIVHLGTRMMGVMDPSPSNHHTPWSPIGWQLQTYWAPPRSMEKNVWELFRSSIHGNQGLLNAKRESGEIFTSPVRFGRSAKEVVDGVADIYVHTGDSRRFMSRLPEGSADYIFTDPPYDAAVQYGELGYLWSAWLKKDVGYLERISADEVVRNERQHKDSRVYEALLRDSFQRMFYALRSEAYLTVTFHNPTLRVRKATIEAGVFAGFAFEKIHHQPLAQRSAKSMWDPFGSAQGDFYLRFFKPEHPLRGETPTATDDHRFERVVVETTKEILAERGEPTPYTFIINKIDPELAKNGFFSSLTTGLDVKKVLRDHLGKEFQLVKTSVGGAEGEVWWFSDPTIIARPELPLAERVEATVLRLLQARGTIEFTEAWEAVSIEFPNSLTPDTTSIMDALKANARPVGRGRWILKEEIRGRENEHNEVIAALADIGSAWGYRVWVGRKEQAAYVAAGVGRRRLRDLVDGSLRDFADQVADLATAEQLDCVWLGPLGPVACFEVEATTSMTSGLNRGSNLLGPVRRYLVIPEERENQLIAKRRSPLFEERWDRDGWKVLHFDYLMQRVATLKKSRGRFEALEGAQDAKSRTRQEARQLRMNLE